MSIYETKSSYIGIQVILDRLQRCNHFLWRFILNPLEEYSTLSLLCEVENRVKKAGFNNALKRLMLKSIYEIANTLKGKK